MIKNDDGQLIKWLKMSIYKRENVWAAGEWDLQFIRLTDDENRYIAMLIHSTGIDNKLNFDVSNSVIALVELDSTHHKLRFSTKEEIEL